MRSLFVGFLAVLFFMPGAMAQSAGVRAFVPTGETKNIQQVKVRFRSDMIPLGDPRGNDPFTADCSVTGKGRWVDTRNWVYEFPRKLSAGEICTFKPVANLRDLAGNRVFSAKQYSFNTGGPAVRRTRPWAGSGHIAQDQYFGLWLDGKVDPESVTEHAWCEISGLAEQVPVRVVQAPEGQSGYGAGIWITCDSKLPSNTKIRLVWDKGIRSPSGVATTSRQTFTYNTKMAFNVQFTCERTKSTEPCMPLSDMALQFSTPIARKDADAVRLVPENGTPIKPSFDKDNQNPWVSGIPFDAPFPPETKFTITLPDDLKDDAGRTLINADKFPLAISTGKYPPLVKFPGRFGILELKQGGVLPVAVRGVEKPLPGLKLGIGQTGTATVTKDPFEIVNWMERLQRVTYGDIQLPGGNWKDVGYSTHPSVFGNQDARSEFALPDNLGEKVTEVIGIPLKTPGFHVVELKSQVLGDALKGDGKPYYVSTGALVTDMGVHFMWGRDSSLVWVTSLQTGKPVRNAKVSIGDTCTKKIIWTGQTDAQGRAEIGADIPPGTDYTSCYGDDKHPLIITASNGEDFAFTLTKWDQGLQPWQFDVPTGWSDETLLAHAVTDRSLFRAGETMSAKIYVRKETKTGVDLPKQLKHSATLRLVHHGSGKRISIPVKLDDNFTGTASWAIPKDARLGTYSLDLIVGSHNLDAGSISIQEYKIPTMQAFMTLPGKPVTLADNAKGSALVRYLAGGVASGKEVRLTADLGHQWGGFSQYPDFTFNYQALEEGTYDRGQSIGPKPVQYSDDRKLTLGEDGKVDFTFASLPKVQQRRVLNLELEYSDANGETYTKNGSIKVWPAKVALGIKTDGWAASEDDLKFTILALDPAGKPVRGQQVDVALYTSKTLSFRKRVVGGFYAYESQRKIKKLDIGCSDTTDANGQLVCKMKPGTDGEVYLQAKAQDVDGNTAISTRSVWLAGKDDWWFDQQSGDRMDILVERAELEPGGIATIQVRSPFRSAQALVAIEREGVVDSFVTRISGEKPVIRVPVKPEYAPNTYVSVLAVRGRVSGFDSWMADKAREYDWPEFISRDGGMPTGLIDLSKPAFKLGIAKLKVGRKGFALKVDVKPEQKSYRIRETAKVDIHVETADGKKLPAGTEVAVAAVDEGLLQLKPNKSWNLLDAMLKERPLSVYTSTSQMQVVGKRHYGRKAVAPGGGGADEFAAKAFAPAPPPPPPNSKPRELFDTLLLWQGRVKVDADGNASVNIPINDSLTKFRVVAVADGGVSRFGTGSADFTVTQPIQIISALPPVVRENDLYQAIFTIRNTTEEPQQVEVTAKNSAGKPMQPILLDIPANGMSEARWETLVPYDVSKVDWDVAVNNAGDPTATDAIHVSQEVHEAIPVKVMQATIEQVKGTASWPVALPADAIAGRGGLDVRMQSSIAGNLDGVTDYMRKYPYSCFEQRTSKAIALQDHQMWETNMGAISSFLDADGLLRYFAISTLQGSDILTSYVLKTGHEAGWDIPEDAKKQMLDGLQGFIEGRVQRGSPLQTSYKTWRQLSALAAISEYGKGNWQMTTAWELNPNLMPVPALTDWITVLENLPNVPNRAEKLTKARDILLARLVLHGTSLNLSSDAQVSRLWWLMENGDTATARTLLALLPEADFASNAPRLTRGLLSRMISGRWNTTTANAWGVLAVNAFSKKYEQTPVTGSAIAQLAGLSKDFQFKKAEEPKVQELPLSVPGKQETLTISHTGNGNPWAIVTAKAAVPLKEPLNAGYRLTRTVEAVERKSEDRWHVGDVIRVKLSIHAMSDMTWVVVDDPVPAGATILGKGFANESKRLTQNERRTGWVWPAFTEKKFDRYIGYYRYVPSGDFSVEYTMRLNTPGRYALPPSRVEAMYKPEQFAATPIPEMVIEP